MDGMTLFLKMASKLNKKIIIILLLPIVSFSQSIEYEKTKHYIAQVYNGTRQTICKRRF